MEIAPSGLRTTTVYDNVHPAPRAMIAPDGARTSYSYNAADRQIRETQPSGGITTSVYDAAQRTIASIDPLAHRWTTVYTDTAITTRRSL